MFTLTKTGNWSYFRLAGLEGVGLTHGFCTRSVPPPPWETGTAEDFLLSFSLTGYVTMSQEHGAHIHLVDSLPTAPLAGDGLVLAEGGVAGTIRTADCAPVILWEPRRRLAGIVHAGWRGTVLGITGKAVGLMADLGAEPSLLQAIIGPSIGPCCYEVKEDVAGRFRDAGYSDGVLRRRQGALFLDLRQANIEDLEGHGVFQTHVLDLCTRCRPDLFYSAQRNDAGRQMSFVALTG